MPIASESKRSSGPSRTSLAAWNLGTSVLFLVCTTAVALISTPLLIGWLGQVRYGAVRMLIEYAGYLSLLELGLGGAVAPMLAQALGRDDEKGTSQVLAAASRTYLRVAVATVLVGLAVWPVIGWLVPVRAGPSGPGWWSQVLGGTSLDLEAVRMVNEADLSVAWLVMLSGSFLLIFSPYRALVEANQRGYQINLLLLQQALVVVALSLGFARLGGGISGQSLANLLGQWPTYAILLALALARYPGRVLDPRAAVAPEVREQMRRLSRASLKLQVCGRISFMTDAIVLGGFLGSAQVTLLYVTQRLAVLVQGFLSGIGSAVWAGLAELHAQGEHELFRKRVLDVTQGISLLGMAALGPVVAGNDRFVAFWVGADQYGGASITVVAAVNAYLLALLSFWGWCFNGTGQSPLVVRLSVVGAVVNLTVSVALTAMLRITAGPLLGTLASFLGVSLVGYVGLLERHFGVPRWGLVRAAVRPLVLGVPVSAAFWLLMREHRPANLLVLAAEMGALGLVILALGYGLLLDRAERREWRDRLARALPVRRLRGDESENG